MPAQRVFFSSHGKSSLHRPSDKDFKEECIARVRLIPSADPHFLALAEKCVVNTAYVHVVRDCQAVKRWDTSRKTLLVDTVFKLSTMLGNGANYAILDALDLAEKLRKPNSTLSSTLRFELLKSAAENVKRRLRERQRGALVQNLVYLGVLPRTGFENGNLVDR